MKEEETVLRKLVDEIVTPKTIWLLRDENVLDVKEAVMAIAEVVATDQDPTSTRDDIIRILSLLDYIDPKDESKFASYLLFPTEKER